MRVCEDGTNLTVVVSDTGSGIAAEDLKVVFDMFVQVSGTARSAQGGLGIGLMLAKSLIELHGGQVKATSAGLGHGSEFRVTLPLAQREVPVAQVPGEGGNIAGEGSDMFAGLSILVVDDNRDAADSLGDLLLLHGAKVEVAYGGVDGLSHFASSKPRVAILDIGMPEMDGYELARRLSSVPEDEKPFLIALTGWGQVEDRARIFAAGFDLHLVKPVDFAELADSLSKTLLE